MADEINALRAQIATLKAELAARTVTLLKLRAALKEVAATGRFFDITFSVLRTPDIAHNALKTSKELEHIEASLNRILNEYMEHFREWRKTCECQGCEDAWRILTSGSFTWQNIHNAVILQSYRDPHCECENCMKARDTLPMMMKALLNERE